MNKLFYAVVTSFFFIMLASVPVAWVILAKHNVETSPIVIQKSCAIGFPKVEGVDQSWAKCPESK